jgi:hypothetical protein
MSITKGPKLPLWGAARWQRIWNLMITRLVDRGDVAGSFRWCPKLSATAQSSPRARHRSQTGGERRASQGRRSRRRAALTGPSTPRELNEPGMPEAARRISTSFNLGDFLLLAPSFQNSNQSRTSRSRQQRLQRHRSRPIAFFATQPGPPGPRRGQCVRRRWVSRSYLFDGRGLPDFV